MSEQQDNREDYTGSLIIYRDEHPEIAAQLDDVMERARDKSFQMGKLVEKRESLSLVTVGLKVLTLAWGLQAGGFSAYTVYKAATLDPHSEEIRKKAEADCQPKSKWAINLTPDNPCVELQRIKHVKSEMSEILGWCLLGFAFNAAATAGNRAIRKTSNRMKDVEKQLSVVTGEFFSLGEEADKICRQIPGNDIK